MIEGHIERERTDYEKLAFVACVVVSPFLKYPISPSDLLNPRKKKASDSLSEMSCDIPETKEIAFSQIAKKIKRGKMKKRPKKYQGMIPASAL